MTARATAEPGAGQIGSLAELQASLRRQGLLEKDPRRCLAELAFHVATTVAGAAMFAVGGSLTLQAGGLLFAALGSIGVATNGHTATHHGTSRSARLDELLSYFSYPFFLQVSSRFWNRKHVVRHHPAPNVVSRDDDIDLMPLFAYTRDEAARGGAFARFYRRHQWLLFPFALALNGFNVQREAWTYLVGALGKRETRSAAHWIDLGVLSLHWVLWWFIPMAYFPVAGVVLFNLGRVTLMGYGLFALFAPAHFPAAACVVEKTHGPADHLLLQTAGTVNFRTGRYGRLLCSGVEYQIEHHLFPGLSHTRYPAIAPQVEAFCRAHGYPYRTLGWGEAIWESLKTIRRPKPVLADTGALRERLGLDPR